MKRIMLAISLQFCLGSSIHSQEQTPQLLFSVAQCLAVKHFLPSSKATGFTFGYLLDEKSYPGDKVIYVVDYAARTRGNGLVFAVFLTEKNGLQYFNIQNDASFALSKDEASGVVFVSPPLGGTWTQEHLALAIKRIEKQPRFTISIKELSATAPSVHCESYTDSKPQSR